MSNCNVVKWLFRLSWPRVGFFVALLAGGLGVVASRYGRTGVFLDGLNDAPPTSKGQPLDTVSRIATEARVHFEDAYVDASAVTRWMANIRDDFQPFHDYIACAVGEGTDCETSFELAVLPPLQPGGAPGGGTSAWGLPAIAAVPRLGSPELPAELDAERLVANAEQLAAPLAELHRGLPHHQDPGHTRDPDRDFDDPMLQEGIEKGLVRAAGYIARRRAHRDPRRPVTALVLSGGAGNGAFSAGFVSRLLEVFQRCRATNGACGDARVDLSIGTSAGALISVLLDMFFTPGQEKRALDLLHDEFTCGVSSDLYCRNDAWLTRVFMGDVKGLVTFDGLSYLMKTNFSLPLSKSDARTTAAGMDANDVELVTTALDADTGIVIPSSDQDPLGISSVDARLHSVLASNEEPGLSSFESVMERAEGPPLHGTFIDGGVVSPIPALEAVRRGAERTVVVSNWTREQSPENTNPNGIGVLLRSLEIENTALGLGEMGQVNLAAGNRRLAEYHVCRRRFAQLSANDTAVSAFCERRFEVLGNGGADAGPAPSNGKWFKKGVLPWVATSWQSAWIHRPEDTKRPAVGYSFDPAVMQPLYLDGIAEYQRRCGEIHELLGLSGPVPQEECPKPPSDPDQDPFVLRAKSNFKTVKDCNAKRTRRLCP